MRFSVEEATEDYYIIFKSYNDSLSRFILKNNFQHILTLKNSKTGVIYFDARFDKLRIDTLNKTGSNLLIKKNEKQFKVLKVKIAKTRSRNNTLNWFFILFPRRSDCVDLNMRFLGLNGFVLTPYGLYKRLLAKKFINVIEVEEV